MFLTQQLLHDAKHAMHAATIIAAMAFCGCSKPAPRDASLPHYVLVADFSKPEPLQKYATKFLTYGGDASAAEHSIATYSLREAEGLYLDYELAGRFSHVAYCGLAIQMDPSAKRKDWSAIAVEIKLPRGSSPVRGVKIEAKFSRYYAFRYFDMTPGAWALCVVPITWAHTGTPDETLCFRELVVTLTSGITKPAKGSLMIRRVYLMESPAYLPEDAIEPNGI